MRVGMTYSREVRVVREEMCSPPSTTWWYWISVVEKEANSVPSSVNPSSRVRVVFLLPA
jgi:hypothetical protein